MRLVLRFAIVIAFLALFGFGYSLAAAPNQSILQATDKVSAPGCLVIVGKPTPQTCLPCPPLWLGGPTIRCVARLPSDAGLFAYRSAACLGAPFSAFSGGNRNRRWVVWGSEVCP